MKLSPRLLIGLSLFLAVTALLIIVLKNLPDATETVRRPDATPSTSPPPVSPNTQAPVNKASTPAPLAPADAAWNQVASPKGFVAAASAAPSGATTPDPKPGDPLPAHLDKLWPGGKILSQTDTPREFGTERISIIQPGPHDLPYPIRIHEYYPKNGDPVLVSEVIADRILVGKPSEMPHEKFAAVLAEIEGAKVKRLTESGVYQIILQQGIEDPDTIPQAVETLRTQFPVAFAEADPVQRALITPNDPSYNDGSLWGLHNTGQNSGTADADIDAPEGWDIRRDASNVVVAVIDTGVLYTHEDIAANMWTNPGESGGGKETNGIDDDGNGYVDDVYGINAILDSGDPRDDNKHGSHCAGTIAGVGNNGVGVTGVAWSAKIMALKFLSSGGGGALSDAIKCLEYARLKGAKITSNSWGGSQPAAALRTALVDAANAGMLAVIAAGNDSAYNDFAPVYPACYDVKNILSVAATDRNDAIASFSNYGVGSVHVGAPGVSIYSLGINSTSSYTSLSGTSMATPHVSGVAAVLAAQYPTDTPAQLMNRILRGGDSTAAMDSKVSSGRRLNLLGALQASNRPFNDDLAEARVINVADFMHQITVEGATAETSNISDGIANGPAVWYRFSYPNGGNVTISTEGSSYDTIIGVYTGSSITSLTSVATNDNAGGVTSSLSFDAAPGQDYYLAVAGKGSAQGFLKLSILAPVENDHLANARLITPGNAYVQHNRSATKEPGEANHAGNAGGRSIWYKFTPTATGYYTASTNGEAFFDTTEFDTLLAVYAGPASNPTHASLTPVAANDNDPSGYFVTSIVGFHATAGQTYYIAVDGKNGANGDIVLTLTSIGNHDYFASPMVLTGDEHTINSSNRVATAEPGEPDHAGHKPRYTLWYDFTPATSGTFEVDTVVTSGSETAYNTYIAVYTGNALNNLTEVVSAVNNASGMDTLVTFTATAGQSYKIVTGVPYDLQNPFLGPSGLRIRKLEPIANDNFANAIAIPSPSGFNFSTVTGKNRGANMEAGEPPYNPSDGISSTNTVWWKWTANQTAQMQVNTIGSDFDTLLWVYTGNSVNALTQVAFNDDSSQVGGPSLATFNAVSGTTYYFRVSGWNNAYGNIVLNLGRHFVPGNNFANAFEVEPNFIYQTYRNDAANRESGEPVHGGVTEYSRSLWFRFTPTAANAGPVVFSTQGSQSTVVAVYTGTAVNALTEVTANIGFAGRPEAEVEWNAVAGTTYHIAVALKFGGASGTGNVLPYICTFLPKAPNNDFANATTLSGTTVDVTSHNFGANKETGEPSHAGNSGGRSVWFNWIAPTSGLYRISTAGSNVRCLTSVPGGNSTTGVYRQMDTLLGVYTGSAVGSLTTIASNDDLGYVDSLFRDNQYRLNINSEVYLNATAGTTYRIAVDGRNGGTGSNMEGGDWGQIKLDIRPFNRPANDNFANAEEISAAQVPFIKTTDITLAGATTESGEPTHAGNSTLSKNTLWFKFTAPDTATYYASTAGNLYDDLRARNTFVAVYTGSAVNALTAIASATGNLGPTSSTPTNGHASEVGFNATAGTTYYIAIGAEFPGPISFMLVKRPSNDDFANATEIWGSNLTAIGYNVGASGESGELDPYNWMWSGGRTGQRRSVWFKWTPPVSGTYTVDTYNSDLWSLLSIHTVRDTALQIVTGEVSDAISMLVLGDRSFYDRRARGTQTLTYSFTGGTTYYFRVAGDGKSADSGGPIRLEITGPAAIPPVPQNFTGSRSTSTIVLLTWRDLSNDETAYELERSTDGSNWTALATLAANTVNYLDATAPAADLHYRLRATNSLGQSGWVTTFVAMPAPPAAPANFSGTATSTTSVTLTWDAVANATSLRLERSATGHLGPWTLVNGAISGNATFYSDSGLQANTTYWYRLRGTNAIGNGPWSAVAAVTTLNTATLVNDPFTDGGVTDGTDPLDVAWSTAGGNVTVTIDSTLDSGSPANVLQASTTTTEGDVYAYFTLPGGNQTLAVGETLKLSFKLRHTGTPRTDSSRTGFSFAYTPGNSPWSATGNREYMFRTSYGSTGNWTYIARTADVQMVNSSGTDVQLINSQPGINAGTNATAAWMEIERTGNSTVVIRAKLGSNPVIQTTDTGVANGGNSGIITTFNRVFFRFRTVAGGTNPQFRLDDVVVTKSVAGTPNQSQHPITVWRNTHWGTTANTGNAADTADPDGDGIPNLVEYALGSNPTSAGSSARPEVGTTTVGGQQRLTLSFTPQNTAGLQFIIQASTDLSDWSDQTDVTSSLTEGQLFEFIDSANIPTTPRRFLRLRVLTQ